MTVYQCAVCRAYRRDSEPHPCPGLRTVDWLRFVGSLRDWTTTDNAGRFEAYYARRAIGERRRHLPGRSPDAAVIARQSPSPAAGSPPAPSPDGA